MEMEVVNPETAKTLLDLIGNLTILQIIVVCLFFKFVGDVIDRLLGVIFELIPNWAKIFVTLFFLFILYAWVCDILRPFGIGV